MAGNQLFGVSESMHHLASITGSNADSMTSTVQGLNSQLEGGLRSGWMGAGGNMFFDGHGVWNGNTSKSVLQHLFEISDLKHNAANRYDYTDTDAQSAMSGVPAFSGGIGAAINPSA